MLLLFTTLLVCTLAHAEASGRSKRSFFIVEGTNWCGQGNKAKDCFDVGKLAETDLCCREHDYCPYTFAPVDPLYNGYETDTFHSVSHCECDKIFFDCLQEKPYKKGSFYILSAFKSIADSCFAYLPCDDADPARYQSIWSARGERRAGKCHNNFKVIVFDSTDDYDEFMRTRLTLEQLEAVGSKLATNTDEMMSPRKKSAPCLAHFTGIPAKIATNFESKHIASRKKASSPASDDKGNTSLLYSLSAHQRIVNRSGGSKPNQTDLNIQLSDLIQEPSSKGPSYKSILAVLSVVAVMAAALAIRR